jgi:hypothetical protein
MPNKPEQKCECGGDLKFYDGALGYEAMRCVVCWEDWHYHSDNPNEHQEHVARYRAGERNGPKPLRKRGSTHG